MLSYHIDSNAFTVNHEQHLGGIFLVQNFFQSTELWHIHPNDACFRLISVKFAIMDKIIAECELSPSRILQALSATTTSRAISIDKGFSIKSAIQRSDNTGHTWQAFSTPVVQLRGHLRQSSKSTQ
jgi:hypothetical protein